MNILLLQLDYLRINQLELGKFKIFNMKKIALLLVIAFTFGCGGSVNDCGEIDAKYIKDGEYFLVINLSNQRPNGDNNDDPGGEILTDAKVSKSVYDLKNIGDEFCFEN